MSGACIYKKKEAVNQNSLYITSLSFQRIIFLLAWQVTPSPTMILMTL